MWTTLDKKIASVGIHLRRYIASHGIGLNVTVDLSWFNRIIACGLVGKHATNFEEEGVKQTDLAKVADVFANAVATNLRVDGAEKTSLSDIMSNGSLG